MSIFYSDYKFIPLQHRNRLQPMIVQQSAQDRLLEKQWRARIWMAQNPFANAANCQVRIKMRNRLQRKMESKVLQFK